MSQFIKFSVALLFCLSFSDLLEAREFYSQKQAIEILNQKDVDEQLRDFANSSSANARIQLLDQWQTDQNIEPLVQEKLLYEATLLLRQSEVLGSAERIIYQQALSNLLSYQSKAYLPRRPYGFYSWTLR